MRYGEEIKLCQAMSPSRMSQIKTKKLYFKQYLACICPTAYHFMNSGLKILTKQQQKLGDK